MVVGQGYIATGAGLASFTGLPNQTSPVGPALLNGSGGNNFNLVGNPYPAPVSVASFLAANSANISGAVYVWDDDASGGANYAAGDFIISNGIGTVNGPNSGLPFSGNIASCQGFFVEKTSGGAASIQFTHAMKTYGTNSEFFDVTTASRMRLRMENVNGQGTETIIAFIDDATEGVDNQYDATSFPGNADLTMYTFNGEGRYVIQAWPVLNTERVIDLGVVNTVVGTSRISMNMFENFDASTVVYVEDVQEGIFHNLTQDGDYVYNNTGLTGEQPVRFRIHFRAPIAVASSMDCSGQEMGKIIVANPNTTPVTLEVVNEMNAVVATAAAFTGEHEVSGLAAGTYTLNMSYPEGTQISRNAVVETNGMTAPATFIASATTVSIADAIIEFQGTAQGATTYMWDFGDGSAIVTGDMNPVHAYDAPGVYTVTFTALANGCGSFATTTITVTNETTGIANVSGNNGFTIYPNPASDVANLLLNVDKSTTDVTISIQDAAGRLVSTQQVNEVRSGAIIALPVDALVNGVYQVTVEGKNFRNVGRLTIAK
jgi:PKD repeat protein